MPLQGKPLLVKAKKTVTIIDCVEADRNGLAIALLVVVWAT